MLDPVVEAVRKEYVPLDVEWYSDGALVPACLYLEGGGVYEVDGARRDGMKASRCGCGYGLRYTVRTSCEDEENYNKLFFLYLERYGTVGAWRCDGLEIEMVVVRWDEHGAIFPQYICLEDGSRYKITEWEDHYPMSTRKSDGAGMRYIVRASCPDLQDYNRQFYLMLENGGEFIGSWFLEDYCATDNWDADTHTKVIRYK